MLNPSPIAVTIGPGRDVDGAIRVLAAGLFLGYFGLGLRTLGEVGPVPL